MNNDDRIPPPNNFFYAYPNSSFQNRRLLEYAAELDSLGLGEATRRVRREAERQFDKNWEDAVHPGARYGRR